MGELAFVLVIILWVLYYRKTKSLTERVTMLEEESVKINSDYEFWLAEKIISEWNVQ